VIGFVAPGLPHQKGSEEFVHPFIGYITTGMVIPLITSTS